LGGSEYLALLHEHVAGQPPLLDLAGERALQRLVIGAIRDGSIESAHDCAEGGLAVALAECCFDTAFGVDAEIETVSSVLPAFALQATLFGESASRVIVSARPETVDALLQAAREAGVTAATIGTVTGKRIRIVVGGRAAIDVEVADAEAAWATAIEQKMQRR
jgi:phosphoribosylformylglycinamidine synthase